MISKPCPNCLGKGWVNIAYPDRTVEVPCYCNEKAAEVQDNVNHPTYYNSHPSGVECITITEHMNFCLGNAIKYIWRAGEKLDRLEDLKKARWYIDREIKRLETCSTS